MHTPSHAVAVRCTALVKRYGPLMAVDGLNLDVHAGECFGLLGPNGAGKTTTIEILEGLRAPDAGEVEVLGQRWTTDAEGLRQRLGIHLQEAQFEEKLSTEETLRLFRSFYRTGRTPGDVLAMLGLTQKASTWVGQLSGGQRQRLAVGCALVGDPELLFLDEPTTGLDPQSRRQLWAILDEFRRQGGTILLTTHYMDEAETLCDRVAIVDRGRIIALGTPRELVRSLGADHVIEFTVTETGRQLEERALAALPGVTRVRQEPHAWALTTSHLHVVVPALLELVAAHRGELASLATHNATLEDVFVSLTGRHLRDE